MRAKKNYDWVPSAGYGTPDTFAATLISDQPRSYQLVSQALPAMQVQNVVAGNPATPWFDEQLTTIRVVGQVLHSTTTPAGAGDEALWMLIERIHVGLLDLDAINVAAIVPDSLSSSNDAEERFLWSRITPVHLFEDATVFIPYATRADYDIDLRVKRRLAPGEVLVYSAQMTYLTGALEAYSTHRVIMGLRTYVRR